MVLILYVSIVFRDPDWAIPFNIGTPPPPIEGSGYPMGGGGREGVLS